MLDVFGQGDQVEGVGIDLHVEVFEVLLAIDDEGPDAVTGPFGEEFELFITLGPEVVELGLGVVLEVIDLRDQFHVALPSDVVVVLDQLAVLLLQLVPFPFQPSHLLP